MSDTTDMPRQILLDAHYYLMKNPRFWYDRALLDASKILCVIASDLRRAKAERESGKNEDF